VKSLFLAASDLADPAERAAYLNRECGANAELRARVEALLRTNDASPLPEPQPVQTTGNYVPDASADANAGPAGKDEEAGTIIAGKPKPSSCPRTRGNPSGRRGSSFIWTANRTASERARGPNPSP
jgi:hypothetical protein